MTLKKLNLIFFAIIVALLSAAQAQSAQAAVMTPGQHIFAHQLAAKTHLDGAVVKAWVLAETSGSAARHREALHNHNWLNWGYFDSSKTPTNAVWRSPKNSANAIAKTIMYRSQFRGIRNSAGKNRETQIRAIVKSGWAASGYDNGKILRVLIKRYFKKG